MFNNDEVSLTFSVFTFLTFLTYVYLSLYLCIYKYIFKILVYIYVYLLHEIYNKYNECDIYMI